MLHTMAILAEPISEHSKPHTSTSLAKQVKMSNQGMLRLLERAKKMNWCEWGKDALGRRSWTITDLGFNKTFHNLQFRVKFRVGKKTIVSELMLKIVKRAMGALKKLLKAGFSDIQAREELIRYELGKIEWAIRMTEPRQGVENKGAYMRTLIEKGHWQQRRCRAWVEKAHPTCPDTVVNEVVREACRTDKPLNSAILMAAGMGAWYGRKELDDVCLKLSRTGLTTYRREKKKRAPLVKVG